MITLTLTHRAHHLRPHAVAAAAADRLQASPHLLVRQIACEYDHGVLFLRGRLPSFYQKQMAQTAVAGLEGVAQVVNEIEVVGSRD